MKRNRHRERAQGYYPLHLLLTEAAGFRGGGSGRRRVPHTDNGGPTVPRLRMDSPPTISSGEQSAG